MRKLLGLMPKEYFSPEENRTSRINIYIQIWIYISPSLTQAPHSNFKQLALVMIGGVVCVSNFQGQPGSRKFKYELIFIMESQNHRLSQQTVDTSQCWSLESDICSQTRNSSIFLCGSPKAGFLLLWETSILNLKAFN